MRASIELGRAVLATSAADLELWCKTLITISPQQQCTNLEQHSAASLLELISSNKVWVGRGNGLHIDLDITFNRQPVADAQLRTLSDAILDAPIWRQLRLQPALPNESTHGPGKLRLLVDYAIENAAVTARPHPSILPDVSAADLQPPEGVLSLTLDSIGISADIFQPVLQRKIVKTKRPRTPKTLDIACKVRSSQLTGNSSEAVTGEPPSQIHEAVLLTPGRKRPNASTTERPGFSPAAPLGQDHQKASPAPKGSETLEEGRNPESVLSCAALQLLVDGALRLSVLSTINNKLFPDLKVKANTFELGLIDIAPILWRPDYAPTMSQRVHLLPVIARSFSRPSLAMHIGSKSLQKKLSTLAKPSLTIRTMGQEQGLALADALDESMMTSNIVSRLWQYSQKTVPRDPATCLQSFIATDFSPTSTLESDQWPEGSLQQTRKDRTVRSGAVGPSGDGTPDIYRNREGDDASQPTLDRVLFPQCFPDTGANFEHVKMIDDEMLLADAAVMSLAPDATSTPPFHARRLHGNFRFLPSTRHASIA